MQVNATQSLMFLGSLCWETQSERAAPLSDDTSSDSSTTRKLCRVESNWRLQPDTICKIISQFASNTELFPVGAQSKLATSKLIFFMNEIHVAVPTGVIRTPQERQGFLIMGKDINCFLGLVVYPTIV